MLGAAMKGLPDSTTRLSVRVQPGASKNEVIGFQADVLRVRVTAPPQEGRANKALVELLSDWLGVPKRSVTIIRGETSRDKVVEVRGLPEGKLGHSE